MLDDLDAFMTVEVVEVEEETKEVCFWSPGLGSPTLVVPAFSMTVSQLTTPMSEKIREEKTVELQFYMRSLLYEKIFHLCITTVQQSSTPGARHCSNTDSQYCLNEGCIL